MVALVPGIIKDWGIGPRKSDVDQLWPIDKYEYRDIDIDSE